MNYIDSLRYNLGLLTKYSWLLKPGIYVVHPNLRSYKKICARGYSFLPSASKNGKWFIMYLTSFFYSKIILSGDKEGYDAAYISNMPELQSRDIKLFSTQKKKVLTICQSHKRFVKIIEKKKKVETFFQIPRWSVNNQVDNAFVEEYILVDSKNKRITESYLDSLFLFYTRYYNQVRENKEFHHDGLFFQHGDASIDNVFQSKDGSLFFIDFDHSALLPPFYDIFYQIVNNYIFNNDKQALERITSQKYKSLMEKFEGKSMNFYFQRYVEFFKVRHLSKLNKSNQNLYIRIFEDISKEL